MDELMAQFIVEARELVKGAIDDLLASDVEAQNADRLNGAFRAVHTLKGSVGLFDMPVLQSVLHRAENSLESVRAGARTLDEDQTSALIAVLEWVESCVDDIEHHGSIGQTLLIAGKRFDNLLEFEGLHREEAQGTIMAHTPAWLEALATKVDDTCTVALRYRPHPECYFNGDDPFAILARVPMLRHVSISPRDSVSSPNLYDAFRSNLVFSALSSAAVGEVEAVFKLIPDQIDIVPLRAGRQAPQAGDEPDTRRSDASRRLRIDATRLDALLNTVGELMAIKNGIGALSASARSLDGGAKLARAIAATQKQLDRVVGALYDDVLQARMVPVGQGFTHLPRLVRDLSQRLGKPTELVLIGDELKADKTIVDGLFEPLLHLVRNAMDHGIEGRTDRLLSGKPVKAKLVLEVTQRGEQILLSVSDDGRGIDPHAIRASVRRKGLLSADEIDRLDDRAVLDLLFRAGFSTAAEVSDLSGRGVGLDAVRAGVARLGGTVHIATTVGQGSTFTLRLPVSFAMTQVLLLSVNGERYGVPLQTVAETLRIDAKDLVPVRENRAFVLRECVLPVLSLAELLGMPQVRKADPRLTIAVLSLGEERVGLIVDSVSERAEMVTKPLDGLLTGARGIAGTTVLGDGQVLLVLNVAELIQ